MSFIEFTDKIRSKAQDILMSLLSNFTDKIRAKKHDDESFVKFTDKIRTKRHDDEPLVKLPTKLGLKDMLLSLPSTTH